MLKAAQFRALVLALAIAGCEKDEPTEPLDTQAAIQAAAASAAAAAAASVNALHAAEKVKEQEEAARKAAAAAANSAAADAQPVPEKEAAPVQAPSKAAAKAPAKQAEKQDEKEAATPPALKTPTTGPSNTIQRCCSALARAASTDAKNKNRYDAARAVCTGLAQQVKVGKAELNAVKTTLRAQLQGVPIPSGC